MNQSSNGFLPVIYGFKPTIYMLSVIKHKFVTTNWSSNGFVPPIYNFCMCRVPYTMLCDLDTLCNEVQCYDVRSESMYDGDLCSSTENELKITVPSPMTPTVIKPYVPMALESLQLSESHGGPEFGLCNASTNLNLRDLILLDNQSTVDIFCNKRLLKDIHISADGITVYGNGGAHNNKKKGTLKNYGEVWEYHADAITNILSLKNVRSIQDAQ